MSNDAEYKPSPDAKLFHESKARFRHLCWGVKSGKTVAGGVEICRKATKASARGKLYWVVAPTYKMTSTCEREVVGILNKNHGLITRHNRNEHEMTLRNGAEIHFRSAESPDNLRGPNVDDMWADEAGYISNESWQVMRSRVSATGGGIFTTTTPGPRNWFWEECLASGMPPGMEYGVYEKDVDHPVRGRFVSHFPTWHFDWVPEEEIEDSKGSMPREVFDREYGALFVAGAGQVFHHVEEGLTFADTAIVKDHKYVVGADLAKYQDFTSLIALNGFGLVCDVQRWSGVSWIIQIERIVNFAKRWNAVVVVDRSNVGSVIEENLKEKRVHIFPVDMNSPRVKEDLVRSLQVAFEQRIIQIPHPQSEFKSPNNQHLLNELNAYQATVTRTGRISYGAPRGQHDDLVSALALAQWGRARGLAGGGLKADDASIVRTDMDKMSKLAHYTASQTRNKFMKKMFQRGGRLWNNTGGPLWGG